MKWFETRNQWVESLPAGLRILEIGVFKGEFSQRLLATDPLQLMLVDLFDGVHQSGDKDGMNMQSTDMGMEYLRLVSQFSGEKVSIVKGASGEVIPRLRARMFDVIYIDADHSNPALKNDLHNSLPLLAKGGILCGHDYHEIEYPDVYREVNRIAESSFFEWDFLTKDRLPSFGLRLV
jgi:hypothetical protein